MSENVEEGEILAPVLRVINALEAEGIIGRYAIGGAMGVNFYAEVAQTDDLDIFCLLPGGLIVSTAPVYKRLAELGYEQCGGEIMIAGVPVQFLGAGAGLVTEALTEALDEAIEGVPTRVFQYEHLLAIMVETGRAKDKARIPQCLESTMPDRPNMPKLEGILKKHGLLDKWRRIMPE